VGYWFWEIEGIPPEMVHAARSVDEIWVATTFIENALQRNIDKPIRRVPIPVRIPEVNESEDAFPARGDAPFTFLVTFDYNSVAARKNPEAAVMAYRMAFPHDDPTKQRLVVKTMNSTSHRGQMSSLRRLSEGRRDIEFIDHTLTRVEQDELIKSSSCLLSLHRSEGLGLHIAEAMASGVPVIATGYSGNMDFMKDDNSLPVEYDLVNIESGGPYQGNGVWAEPDLDDAVDKIREVVRNSRLVNKLSRAAVADVREYSKNAHEHLVLELSNLVKQQNEQP